MPTLKASELWLWLAVNEEQLLLHDGLTRLADHIAVPTGVAEVSEDNFGLPVLDGKSTEDLTEIILKECGTKTTTYASLMEYRLNALRGLWAAVKEIQRSQSSSTSKESTSSSRGGSGSAAGFASRVSLVLIFPIMKSLSRFDPNLSSEAASVLLDCLRVYEPLSLSNEPSDCISGLENLLHSWLGSVKEKESVTIAQVQNAASALVALSVAVGTGSLLLRTVHMLQSLKSTYRDLRLLVPGVLCKLLQEHATQESPAPLTSDAHLMCWAYEDGLVQNGKETSGPRSLAFDGRFVYITSSSLKCLLKLGTGKHGTIRGYIYSSHQLDPGWVVWVDGHLLHRKKAADEKDPEVFCSELDTDTLQPHRPLSLSCPLPEPHHTIHLLSDGLFLYWLYALRSQDTVPSPVTGEKIKQFPVYIQQLQLQNTSDKPVLSPVREPVMLQKASLDRDKNSDMVKALVRANPSYASSLLGGSKDDTSGATSAGVTMRTLQSSAAYATGSSLVVLVPPNTSGGRGLFGPSSAHATKALCINLCFSLKSGLSLSHSELMPSPNLHCALAKGASMQGMAACYDNHSHCVWTTNEDWLDVWECSGKARLAVHHLASRLGKSSVSELIPELEVEQETVEASEAIKLLLRHIGIESCRLVPGYEASGTVSHGLPLVFLRQCCDLLDSAKTEKDWGNCQAIVITLLAVLPAFLRRGRHMEEELGPCKERVRSLVWSLLSCEECPESLHAETRRLISCNAGSLFLSHKDSSEFLNTLLHADSSQPHLLALREELLIQTAHDLRLATSLPPPVSRLSQLLTERVMADSLSAVQRCLECPVDQLPAVTSHHPVFTPTLQCAAGMMSVTLRALSQAVELQRAAESTGGGGGGGGGGEEGTEKGGEGDGETASEKVQKAQEALLDLCNSLDLFGACQKTLEALCNGVDNLLTSREEGKEEGEAAPNKQAWLPAVERAIKSTALGCLLLPLLVVVSEQGVCTLQMANSLQRRLSSLVQLAAQLCGLLYGHSGELSSIKVPAPWATGRLVETIHPVRDNYKFKETVSFPGAKNLYLKFDTRCSSQYDYDKVIVYAGDSPSASKVCEYGGNTHGFGSRSVLGKGWPKDLVKVEGDTVTFTFDMKSGREHSTPDRAMWGFACTVRPQESPEEGSTGLPFAIDLYLSLASVCCSLIGSLYNGPMATPDEGKCRHLMDSELLQRCVWHVPEGPLDSLPLDSEGTPIAKPPSHQPLPSVVIERLRELAKKPRPLLRPSTSELLQPDLLEDAIVSVCLKQHGLESALKLLGQAGSGGSGQREEKEMEAHCNLLDAVFTRINGLERRLQALVELERNWWHDVEDIVQGSMTPADAFFFSLLQHETSLHNFELLCCLKEVDISHGDIFASTKQLQDLIELDVERRRNADKTAEPSDPTPVTRQLIKGVMERAHLLFSVTIAPDHTPSSSSYPSVQEQKAASQDDTALTSPMLAYARSISAPPITAEYAVRRQRSGVALSRSKQALLEISSCPDKSNLLDQIFQFIGSKPEEAVSPDCFLSAASQQWRRGVCRVRALGYLHQLLCSEHITVMAVEHLLASVGSVIQQGPGVGDIACGGMAQPVRESFANVMHAVAELASKQPAKCINTIAMLCIVPYTRLEESCLVRSGLVKLLDRLCSQVDSSRQLEVGREEDEAIHRVTSLAWAAFQVLADRCVSWESQETAVVSSGLAQQVSMLLTNHLSRAMDSLVVSETGASEGLQDALSLLLDLAKSHMGRAILSQPACVSKLLLLLTDQRPSPKLVLIALQLCRIALPLMTMADCSQVTVPPHPSLPTPSGEIGLAADIIRLLLAKLAEYVVPDASEVAPKQTEDGQSSPADMETHTPHKLEEEMDESGQASIYVYKRPNESTADILQPLISHDPRQFRLSGHRMQEVMLIDRALSEHGKAEVFTDSYRACQRRALRWASMGFTVSVGPPSGANGESSGGAVDKKKAKAEAAAKKKNLELLKTDPPRPFLSGQVAYSLASEVIGLLHGLVTLPGAAEVWSTAIKEALLKSLHSTPQLIPQLVSFSEQTHKHIASGTPPPSPGELLQASCIANATFAALGGFKESIRPGMKVQVMGEGLQESHGVIQSISERRGVASVQFSDDELCFGQNHTLEVPLSRLLPPQKEMLPLRQLGIGMELCQAICALLKTTPPSISHAHSGADANDPALGLCRLFAEMRTRACMALSYHLQEPTFLKLFEGNGCWEDLRKQMTWGSPGLRLSVVEAHCLSLRMLYRDCARPAPPRIEKPRSEPKCIQLDISREWPPVSSCSFTQNLTSVSYQGPTASTTSTASGGGAGGGGASDASSQPKGVIIYANCGIPSYAPSFYWELEVCHMGDSSSDTAHIAMGYSPPPVKPAEGQPWTYPQDTCLIRSSGRGCQVRGENLLEWNTFRLNSPLKNSDLVGCGWVRGEEGAKGKVYFTLNGHLTEHGFSDVPPEMIPFLHIQKKAVRVRVNFGDRPFAYGEGHAHRNAADVQEGDTMEEVAANFDALPFAVGMSDSEGDEVDGETEGGATGTVVELAQAGPPTKKMKTPIATVGYDAEASLSYQLVTSYDNMLESGPLVRPGGSGQEEESEEEGTSTPQEEDLHALLVKAWETKVFPMIQRRFRNDQERKSGLEQIKGALQLGMESIAQETVEFLYEENGGIPKDLHLPTMDDVKAELGRFTISKVRKSMSVVIQKELPYARCGVRAMQKTQGLTGIVLDIDEHNQLVQVECYLQNEGALVRFWYPVVYLEKPPPGYRKSPTLRGTDAANIQVHSELLRCEASLCSIFCRRALLSTSQLPSSPSTETALDHLHLVAANCLAEPLMEGVTTTTSPDLAPSPSSCLRMLSTSALNIFYANPSQVLDELSLLLRNLSGEVEGLTTQLCRVLQTSPQEFTAMEVKVAESKEAVDISHADATFLVVSCVDERGASPPPSSSFKYPWARALCYKGGLGKSGRQQLQEVARYPSELSNQYCGPTYPSLVLPFNRICFKTGGCSIRPSKLIHTLSLPTEFPLSLAFVHSLSLHVISLHSENPNSELHLCCSRALSICLESLTKLLTRLELPRVLKERTLHLFSEVIWTLCAAAHDGLTPPALPSEFLIGLRHEVVKLYEMEVSRFGKSKQKSVYPPPGGISDGGTGKFSTYFQALLECILATTEYHHKFQGGEIEAPPPASVSGSQVSGSPPPEPVKKSGVRRFRIRRGAKREAAESDPKKKEEWLSIVRGASSLLTHRKADDLLSPAHSEASLTSSLPVHPNSRLIVVTGINPDLPIEEAQLSIRRVCHSFGGLYKDHLYLPVKEAPTETEKEEKEGETETQEESEQGKESAAVAEKQTPSVEGGERTSQQPQEPSAQVEGEKEGEDEAQTSVADDSLEQPKPASDTEQQQQEQPPLPPHPTHQLVGHAVLELSCSSNVSATCDSLLNLQCLQPEEGGLAVTTVSNSLVCSEEETPNTVLAEYLRQKLVREDKLTERAERILRALYVSAAAAARSKKEREGEGTVEGEAKGNEEGGEKGKGKGEGEGKGEGGEGGGREGGGEGLTAAEVCGDLQLFFSGFSGGKGPVREVVEGVWKEVGGGGEGEGEKGGVRVSVETFLQWCKGQAEKNVTLVWQGLFASGYDLHFDRCGFVAEAVPDHQTTPTQDHALVQYVDSLCRHLGISSSSLQPWDITLTEASLSSQQLAPLQGVSLADIRLRFLQLKYINRQLFLLLPVIDLRSTHPLSLGARLSQLATVLFYDVKLTFLHAVLNASTHRSLDQAPPEIKMDPLESLTGVATTALETQFCKAAQQMSSVPSPQLCVPLASGGDPTYAFNVKLSGEEVHGTSGSFRHFVWQVVRELQSSVLPILLPCPSGGMGVNKGKYILAPGNMSYSEEKLLQFFGQLLGVAIRADVPIALDLLPCFWKSLKGETLSLGDLQEADCITYNLTQKMLQCSSVEEFDELLTGLMHSRGEEGDGGARSYQQHSLKFVFHTMDGREEELCPGGSQKDITYENRQEFVKAVREFRLKELSSEHRMASVRCGLASIIPLQLLNLFTPLDLDLRVCGLPDINLEYLKRHTKYHVGLEETDKHVQFFWNALESFSQEELRKFIKFACNQERIPFGHPCRDGGKDSAMHVPPYPMKIAPPDGSGPPDSRYIRAETCMFMIKLPQYSSQEIMNERLRYAIHCMEDPLSG